MLRGNKHLLYGSAGFIGGASGALLAEVVGSDGSNASVLGSIIHVALWAAIFAATLALALALALTWAGDYYAGRRWMKRSAAPSPPWFWAWLAEHRIAVSNVAGPRERQRPGV